MKTVILFCAFLCIIGKAHSQQGTFTTIYLNGYKLVAVTNSISDSLSTDKFPTANFVYQLVKRNSTILRKGSGILFSGTANNPTINLDFDNVIERLTATQILARPKGVGKIYFNLTSGNFVFWNGTAYRQISTTAAQ